VGVLGVKHPENPRDWYGLGRWKKKQRAQLRAHPLCAFCIEKGLIVRGAIVDHIERVDGDWNRFWTGALQSLCKTCHESSKKYQERRGFRSDIGPDGYPLDPLHPVYQQRTVHDVSDCSNEVITPVEEEVKQE